MVRSIHALIFAAASGSSTRSAALLPARSSFRRFGWSGDDRRGLRSIGVLGDVLPRSLWKRGHAELSRRPFVAMAGGGCFSR